MVVSIMGTQMNFNLSKNTHERLQYIQRVKKFRSLVDAIGFCIDEKFKQLMEAREHGKATESRRQI